MLSIQCPNLPPEPDALSKSVIAFCAPVPAVECLIAVTTSPSAIDGCPSTSAHAPLMTEIARRRNVSRRTKRTHAPQGEPLFTLMLFPPRRLPRHGDSSQRGDDPTRLTPICGLPIGLEQPLCGLDVRGAALEPASHEKINPRGKSQSSCCRHKPCIQALIGWSLEVVPGVHLALLPIRRRERPYAESYTLALSISPASS
jgi:hypothetical protein